MPGKDFDELIAKDREFTVRGHKFHYRDLSPEAIFAEIDLDVDSNGVGVWAMSDLQILRFLPEDEHESWRTLRADQDNPVTLKQMNALVAWLWEEATGHPLPGLESSATGDGKTATSSSGKSR